ncbi:MAG: hypothetical protein ACLQUY_06980, partial [Ktedonobacterales bacterium]
MMSRKDTVQDLDRPHYYSQFWIDVAQGKRDLSAIRSVESDVELEDIDVGNMGTRPEPLAESAPKPKAPKIPEKKVETARPVISSLADLANIDLLMKSSAEMDSDEVPDIEAGAMDDLGPFGEAAPDVEPSIVTDFDLEDIEDEPEEVVEESLADTEDFDEEEEEDEWGAPRKSSKPQKPRRQPRER